MPNQKNKNFKPHLLPWTATLSNFYSNHNISIKSSLLFLGVLGVLGGSLKKRLLYLAIILTYSLIFPFPFSLSPSLSAPTLNQTLPAIQYRADYLLKLGNTQLTNGQLAAALTSLQESIRLYQQIGDRTGEANALLQLGETHFTLGQYKKAIYFYQQSLTLMQELDNQPSVVKILERLSNTYFNLGDEKLAKKLQERATALRREIGNPDKEAAFLSNVGLEHEMLGEYQQAISFHSQQLAIAKETNNRNLQNYSLQNIAAAYRQLKQYPQAIAVYQQQLELANQSGDKSLANLTLQQLAKTYELQGDFNQAIACYQQQLELTQKSQNSVNKPDLIKQLGRAYAFAGQYDKALALYQEQLTSAKAAKDIFSQGIAYNNLAFVFLKSGKLTDAQNNLTQSIKAWQSLRLNLGSTQDYAAEQAYTYSLLQQVLIAQKQPEAALEITEAASTMAFLKLLGMRLASESAGTNLKLAPKQIVPPTINQIQTIAKQQKATLVKYTLIPDEGIYIWVIQPTGKVTFRKINPNSENTISPITSIKEVIASIPTSLVLPSQVTISKNNVNPLLQLNQLLIKPIADLLPKNPTEQVIFIPQDELWFVPFPALIDISGKYLIEKHTITTIPAIQILQLTKDRRNNTGGSKVVVVGNPTMPKIDDKSQPLPPLINAEQEALEIADFLKTTAFIGNQATKANILPLLPKAKTIHLATYGILDNVKRQGIPGAIALANTGDSNGLLTASEIINLYTQPKGKRLRAGLVFLSAGETDNISTGEGVLGLSLALITAGVPSIIFSQWAAPDTPSAAITTEFYRQLKQNPNKAQALRNAMLTTMKQYPNPKDWGAFSLIGEAK
ncbi:CHAT domain-containing protein [Nostoc sp. CENA67]|uniref:CHAT domain-containing protein n=1 Tax=Amazonocrinis nigriterrae CENA67 TaxID=2794033 RepID=A0A8J7HLP2_9NOST|nr:CHAT domain-containing tetratricopeptide repeat protein [Amazonocrinis nigriterrae]MBH8560895.1 CHAT domain-containing protein [Amazonocrinis nigriterrae CENA67]